MNRVKRQQLVLHWKDVRRQLGKTKAQEKVSDERVKNIKFRKRVLNSTCRSLVARFSMHLYT